MVPAERNEGEKMRLNDVDLARRLLAGDPTVFDDLSMDLWPIVSWRLKCGFPTLFSREDLEDLAQEWLLRMWCHHGEFDPDRGTVVSWAAAIALNAARDVLRRDPEKQRRCDHGVDLVEFGDLAAPPPYPEPEEGHVSDDVRRLRECLADLTERQREVLFARFACDGEPPSSRELGELFQTTPAAMRKEISRLVAKILRHFERDGNRPDSESPAEEFPGGGVAREFIVADVTPVRTSL